MTVFRQGMMSGKGLAGRLLAEPAIRHLRRSVLLLGQILPATMFGMFAGHVLGSLLVGGEGVA